MGGRISIFLKYTRQERSSGFSTNNNNYKAECSDVLTEYKGIRKRLMKICGDL